MPLSVDIASLWRCAVRTFPYPDASGYTDECPAGDYDLEVRPAEPPTCCARLQVASLRPDSSMSVYAIGLLRMVH
jgi:hypothetical protein